MSPSSSEPLDLETIKFDPRYALMTPPSLMIRRRLLPLLEIDGSLHVAVERTLDTQSARLLERFTKFPVVPVVATPDSIRALQTRLFGNLREAITQDRPLVDSATKRAEVDQESAEEAVALCDQVLKTGLIRGASDIHFNVNRDGSVQVRMRIDGVLTDDPPMSAALRSPVFNRLKVLGGLDIAEKRASQDGSFSFDPGSALPRTEVRVATIPARHGERVTLRLLSRNEGILTLDRLGFSGEDLAHLTRAVGLPHGMVLLTGPTGSGKSTTLYAAIKHLLGQRTANVMTVEDPIEYEIDGVTQTEVDARREKVSFASSLRSILRHDPDVIMLGEIRDRETAELAVRAALTGHLVLSTLHTNTAVGAVSRLLDLGVDRFLIATVLRLVAAQRLVRTLCQHCLVESPISKTEAELLGDATLASASAWRPTGCLHCAGKGFTGRSGLFEILPIRSNESQLIGSTSAVSDVENLLTERRNHVGIPSLRASGIAAILGKRTTVDEVITATLDSA